MSEDLIARLVDDLRPVPAHALTRRLALAVTIALAVAASLMIIWLGPRPDMGDAVASAIFWIKSGYTAGLALTGIWAVERLGRPGHSGRLPLALAFALVAALAGASIVDYALASAEARVTMVLGSSALICPVYIAALSVPFLVSGFVLMRRLAPTRLILAGAAAGLMAGGLGAWVYSFHCTEAGLPFLALWYSLGVAAVTSVGAVLGRPLLRW